MSNTLTFAKLDLLTLKPYWKNTLYILVFGALWAVLFKMEAFVSMMYMIYPMMLASYPFAVGDQNGIDLLYATFPLARREIVRGRYLMILLLSAAMALLSLLVSFVIRLTGDTAFVIQDQLLTMSVTVGLMLFFVSIQLPLYFKMGYSKARMISIVPFFLIGAGGGVIGAIAGGEGAGDIFRGMEAWIEANQVLLMVAPLLFGLILFGISCLIATKFYESREF